ncbi:MAG: CRISPR-associated protein Csx11 [Desulfonauticus sp.]|nr:CRISPR-associated protein Csx11 [Desulfonauticus sp.]
MSNLYLGNLKNNRNEILKAEIGSLLFNLGKTHAGFNHWRKSFPEAAQLFSSYKDYYEKNHFENDLLNADSKLKRFIFNKTVRLPDGNEIDWKEFFWGDASNNNFIKKVFFRGCENINSGIDKGSPKQENQLEKLWISNAFGSYKREIKVRDFDESRICFLQDLHRFLEDKHYYSNSDWIEIRNWISDKVRLWYLNLLSDSRFPVNDVTLWAQAYMTSSMFKAVLAQLFLNTSKLEQYQNNPSSIKWSILGIQYDKLGLSEKGLKAGSIRWYRERSKKVDNEIKKLLEVEYPIGNEVYRDETGIYFVVGEDLKGDKSGNFYKLHSGLNEIKEKIQEIFTDQFKGEIYPAIFLTEPSRGIMNLGHLLEKAKENFLKAEIPLNFKEKLESQYDSNPQGICQICKLRLANKQSKDDLICDVCKRRMEGRIDEWIENLDDETIWIDELQDKNGRIALVTLKFELDKWINGDLVNSLVGRDENFGVQKENIKYLFLSVKKQLEKNEIRKLELVDEIEEKMSKFLDLFDENGVKKPYDECYKKLKNNKSISNIDKDYRNVAKRLLKEKKWLKHFLFFEEDEIWTNRKKEKKINIRDYDTNTSVKDHLYKIFLINFFIFQIYNLLLERSIGSNWEKFIKDKLKENKLEDKIDFEEREIVWHKLNVSDIEFLSNLILQFLLRKNPSPARLKRVWDTTREFFEELSNNIVNLAGIKENRQKRLVWNGIEIEDGEYCDGDILFWAKNKTVYLISSIEKIAGKNKFHLRKYKSDDNSVVATLDIEDATKQPYKLYFSIMDPTPISWQFIIPAENIPILIKNVQEEYFKHFRYVYGKLPLHIGVIIQDYKKPLYVGIKALRKIRRDKQEWNNLRIELSTKAFKARQKKAFHYQQSPEQISDSENFYSFFEKIDGEGRYQFYLYPETGNKIWLDTTQNSADSEKFYFYQNTFDFEFLDTNARRNDIFYKDAKRFIKLKQNRPYDIEEWQYFKEFKNFFEKRTSQLQKLVSLIYSKLEDWQDNDTSFQKFIISSFVNILDLKGNKDNFAQVLGFSYFEDLNNLTEKAFKEKMLMFLDMFEFWHTGLKEV